MQGFLSKDLSFARNALSVPLSQICPQTFFSTQRQLGPQVNWEWSSPNTAHIWGQKFSIEGTFKNKKLDEGKIFFPEATFSGKFRQETAVIGTFEKGKILFEDGDSVDVQLEGLGIIFANYFEKQSGKNSCFSINEVKKYLSEDQKVCRTVGSSSIVIANVDPQGNYVSGVELSILGAFRSEFDFLEHRLSGLRNILGLSLESVAYSPRETSLLGSSIQKGRVTAFKIAKLPGHFVVALNDVNKPSSGQGVYCLGGVETKFGMAFLNGQMKFLLDLEILDFEKFVSELAIRGTKEDFSISDSVGHESIISIAQFTQLLNRYQTLWDNHDHFKESTSQHIHQLTQENTKLRRMMGRPMIHEKMQNLLEENSLLNNCNQNLKLLYHEKEKEMLGLSREIRERELSRERVIKEQNAKYEKMNQSQNDLVNQLHCLSQEYIKIKEELENFKKAKEEIKITQKEDKVVQINHQELELVKDSNENSEAPFKSCKNSARDFSDMIDASKEAEEVKSSLKAQNEHVESEKVEEGELVKEKQAFDTPYPVYTTKKLIDPEGKWTYIGDFKEEFFHGKGEMIYSKDNVKFNGIFNEGVFESGTIEYFGWVYLGETKDNKLNGKGKIVCNEFEVSGEFENNKLLDGNVVFEIKQEKNKRSFNGTLEDGVINTEKPHVSWQLDLKNKKIEQKKIGDEF